MLPGLILQRLQETARAKGSGSRIPHGIGLKRANTGRGDDSPGSFVVGHEHVFPAAGGDVEAPAVHGAEEGHGFEELEFVGFGEVTGGFFHRAGVEEVAPDERVEEQLAIGRAVGVVVNDEQDGLVGIEDGFADFDAHDAVHGAGGSVFEIRFLLSRQSMDCTEIWRGSADLLEPFIALGLG